MTKAVLRRSITLLTDLGIDDVRLTGGEPTVHPDFPEVLEFCKNHNMSVGIASNGIRLFRTAKFAHLLRKFDRCWISVYGITSETHRATGGRATMPLRQTLECIARESQNGLNIGVSALLGVGEYQSIDGFMTLIARLGLQKLRFLPVQPDGRMRLSAKTDWSIFPKEIEKAYQIIRNHPDLDRFSFISINTPFGQEGSTIVGAKSCLLRRRAMWSISPRGDVFPCCFTYGDSNSRLGNVFDKNIEQILRSFRSDSPDCNCYGLKSSFWLNANPDAITCPISSLQVT